MTHPAPTNVPTNNLFRLDGRTIIISGGAGAVGTTVGKAILESGGDVLFVDVLAQPSPEIWTPITTCADANKTMALYQQLNVQDEASIKSAFESVVPRLRYPTRGLVCCAAISGESDAVEYPADIFRAILDVNIVGTFLMTRVVADMMHRDNVTGSIVLFASISGHISNKGINTAAYNASKAAVHQLARSLAAEWGHPQNTFPGSTVSATNPDGANVKQRKVYPPIRVNTISPGHIDTPLSQAARERGLTDEWAKQVFSTNNCATLLTVFLYTVLQNMLGRISQPEEFRAPVLFLLGDGSSYMTGADLRVDAGHCAW